MSGKTASSGGTSIIGLLGVLFVALKLTGYISWSWWYVTMPFWLPALIVIAILLVLFGIKLILEFTGKGGKYSI